MAFILMPVEKDCVCLVSGKRQIAHEGTEMSVLVSGKRHFAHEASDATGSSADSATGLALHLAW